MRKSTGIDLDDFVAALSQEGSKESSGVFTLDPEHARRKLREFLTMVVETNSMLIGADHPETVQHSGALGWNLWSRL